MAVSDCVEGLRMSGCEPDYDAEAEEALSLTRDDLRRMWQDAEPAELARARPSQPTSVVGDARLRASDTDLRVHLGSTNAAPPRRGRVVPRRSVAG